MAMKIYTVHTNGWSASADADAILIREGFNVAAFLFGPFWALWHGMWRTAIALLLLAVAVSGGAMAAGLADGAELVLSLGVQAATGLWGNDWRRHVLARRGVLERTAIAAPGYRDAERRHLVGGA